MENMTMRLIAAAPKSVLTCATQPLGTDFWGNRVRMTAPTTGMGHVGTQRIVFGADYVPGSTTWSPPI